MLSRAQWQWLADHQRGAGTSLRIVFWVMAATYFYNFLNVFWWNNKLPLQYQPPVLKSAQLGCLTFDVYEMFIPSENKILAFNGDYSNYSPDPLERSDARILLLEKYETRIWGTEILEKRPDCLGAFIADKQGWPEPIAMRVVDRSSGRPLYRIALVKDNLRR